MPTPSVIQYPAALDDDVSLIEAGNNAASPLDANISVGHLLIPPVTEPGKFSSSGIATLTDSIDPVTPPTKIEIFVYIGKSGNNLVVPPAVVARREAALL
jgi:hypothetical protein